MDDVGHVRVLGLGRGTVSGHVEVARDLGREASARRWAGCPKGGGGTGLHTRARWGGLGRVSSYSVSQFPRQQNRDDNHEGSWEDSMR